MLFREQVPEGVRLLLNLKTMYSSLPHSASLFYTLSIQALDAWWFNYKYSLVQQQQGCPCKWQIRSGC